MIPLVAGLVLLSGFVGGVALLDAVATDLARTGVRTTGEVVRVNPGGKLPATADVRYPVNGVPRTGVLVMEGHPLYAVGDRVTVIHDRGDPDRFRTEEFPNDPIWTILPLGVPLLGGFYLVVRGIAGFVDRRRGGKHRMNGEPRG
ncbi:MULTISPECIES: DUF3592 domain-containing protein [Saccharothrix]|uniref:DUF3592 domain-containing protein n=1 Tax=Saccharothrix TaxID=2071 RepID=UPI0011612CF6|nr:DUF3592 domain-containing protein [Saccharothrix sp. CB00851]